MALQEGRLDLTGLQGSLAQAWPVSFGYQFHPGSFPSFEEPEIRHERGAGPCGHQGCELRPCLPGGPGAAWLCTTGLLQEERSPRANLTTFQKKKKKKQAEKTCGDFSHRSEASAHFFAFCKC